MIQALQAPPHRYLHFLSALQCLDARFSSREQIYENKLTFILLVLCSRSFFIPLIPLAIFVGGDNVIIDTFVELLHSVDTEFLLAAFYIQTQWGADREFKGSSEFRTQLCIENCSKKSLSR